MQKLKSNGKMLVAFVLVVILMVSSVCPLVIEASADEEYRAMWVYITYNGSNLKYLASDNIYGACTANESAFCLYTYKNGSSSSQSVDNISFCIQPGRELMTGQVLKADSTGSTSISDASLQWVIDNRVHKNFPTVTKKQFSDALSIVMHCGYSGKMYEGAIPAGEEGLWYEATQLIIWELAGGFRSPIDFVRYNDVYYNTCCYPNSSKGAVYKKMHDIYTQIAKEASEFRTVVSFSDTNKANIMKKGPDGKYHSTLIDTNGVLDKFNFADKNGIHITRNGNKLTLTADSYVSGTTSFSVKKSINTDPQADGVYVLGGTGKQLVARGKPHVDPPSATFKVKMSDDFTVEIVKYDASASGSPENNVVPIAGFEFQIFKSSDTSFSTPLADTEGNTVFVTGSDGKVQVPMALANGTYVVKEKETVNGYVKNDSPVSFEVNASVKQAGVVTVYFGNDKEYIKLQIHKIKSTPVNATTVGYNLNSGRTAKGNSTWSNWANALYDINGNSIPVKKLTMGSEQYNHVQFEVRALTDIYDGRGVKVYSANDLVENMKVWNSNTTVDVLTTNDSGYTEVVELLPGLYKVAEKDQKSNGGTVSGDGFAKTSSVVDIREQDVNVRKVITITNTPKMFSLYLDKGFVDPEGIISGSELLTEMSRVSFALVYVSDPNGSQNITFSNGSYLGPDDIVSISTCSSDGSLVFKNPDDDSPVLLPAGVYYIEELTTSKKFSLPDYSDDSNRHYVYLTNDGRVAQWYGIASQRPNEHASPEKFRGLAMNEEGYYSCKLIFGDTQHSSFANNGVTLKIKKVDGDISDDPLPGAKFRFYSFNDAWSRGKYLFTCTSDSNGNLKLSDGSDISMLPGGNYAFIEETSPVGYKPLKGEASLGDLADPTSSKNGFRRFTIEIGISNKTPIAKVIMKGYTDAGVLSSSSDVTYSGNYNSSAGSIVINAEIENTPAFGKFELTKYGKKLSSVNVTSVSTYNNNASVTANKYSPNYIDYTLSDIKFTLLAEGDIPVGAWGDGIVTTSTVNGKKVIKSGDPLIIKNVTSSTGEVTTNSSGKATWARYIPYGTYRLRETASTAEAQGFGASQDYIVTVNASGVTVKTTSNTNVDYPLSVYNDYGSVSIKIKKGIPNGSTVGATDADIQNALKGVYFGLYSKGEITVPGVSATIPANSLIDFGHCDASGNLTFTEKLPAGTYTIKEIKCPSNLAFNSANVLDITVTQKPQNYSMGAYLFDNPMYFDLKVVKNGDHWLTATSSNTTYDAGGTSTAITVVKPKFTTHTLSGVQFTLKAAEDIYIADTGALSGENPKYTAGQVVATGVTDANGVLTFRNLLKGKYTLNEVTVPAPYDSSKVVNQTFTIESGTTKTYTNTTGKVSVEMNKTISDSAVFVNAEGIDRAKTLMGQVRFALYATADIKDASGTVVIHNGDCLGVKSLTITGTSASDLKGTANWNDIDLPVGSYKISEIYCPAPLKAGSDVTFSVTADNLKANKSYSFTVDNTDNVFLTPVKVSSRNNQPVGGVTVQFWNKTKDKMLWEGKSRASDGKFVSTGNGVMGIASGNVIEKIKVDKNTYYYKETAVEGNFELDTSWKSVNVNINSGTFTLTIKNAPLSGSVQIVKKGWVFNGVDTTTVSTKNGNKAVSTPKYEYIALPGCKFKLKAAEDIKAIDNPNTVVVPSGTYVQKNGADWEITTGNDGIAKFTGLEFGNYIIEETSAPAGYKKIANQNVTVDKTNKDITKTFDDPNNQVYAEIYKETVLPKNIDEFPTVTKTEVENSIENVEFTLYAGTYSNGGWSGDVQGTIANKPKITAGTPIAIMTCSKLDIPNGLTPSSADDEIWGYGKVSFKYPTEDKVIDLPAGSYTIMETYTPAMFEGCTPYTFTVSANDGSSANKTYSVTKENHAIPHKVKIKKLDSTTNKPVAGAVLQFGYTENGKDTVICEGTTNANGFVEVSGAEWVGNVLPGTYYYKEVTPPTGYEKDTTKHSITISVTDNASETIVCTVKNAPKRGSMSVYKRGDLFYDVTTESDGTATPVFKEGYLAGAEFKLTANKEIKTGDGTVRYAQGAEVGTGTTDANGVLEFKNLFFGEYKLTETKAPDGFSGNYTKVFTINDDSLANPNSVKFTAVNSKNTIKLVADKNMEIDPYEVLNEEEEVQKVVFGIYTANDIAFTLDDGARTYGGANLPKDTLIEKAKADSTGKLEFKKDLPIGKYYALELETSGKYKLDTTKHYFNISTDSNGIIDLTTNGSWTNETIPIPVMFKKVTNDTNKPLAGAELVLRTAKGVEVVRGITNEEGLLVDSKTGNAITKCDLVVGAYEYEELRAPTGYDRDTKVHSLNITTDDIIDGNIIELRVVNNVRTGEVSIYKKGDMFTSIDTDVDGNIVFNYTNEYLKDAEFTITAVGDVITGDKTLRYLDGEVVGTIVTGKDGAASIDGLYYGKYLITETKAPYGYDITFEPQEFEIGDDSIDIVCTADNARHKVEMKAKKLLVQDKYNRIDTKAEITKVVYGLYADEDITFAETDDIAVRKGTLIEKVRCDVDGKLTFKSDLPEGRYYVVEIETSEKYVLDTTKHYFNISVRDSKVMDLTKDSWQKNTPDTPEKETSDNPYKDTNDVPVDTSDTPDTPWKNVPKEFPIRIRKLSLDTNLPLAGAEIIVYLEDGTIIYRGFTDSNGYLDCDMMVPVGIYYYKEVTPPKGYILNDEEGVFSLTGYEPEGYVVDLVIKNPIMMGTISVSKFGNVFATVEKDNVVYSPKFFESYLANAKFGIYADEDIITPDGTLRHHKGDPVDTLITDAEGNVTSKELYLGAYYVKEIEAPYGYTLSEKIVHVVLEDGGEVHFDLDYSNDKNIVKARLHKDMEIDPNEIIDDKEAIFDVSFGLYANEELVANDGKTIPKDGLIERQYCNAEGNILFEVELPDGNYYVQEITTSKYYDLDDAKYEFKVTSEEPKVIDLNDEYTFINEVTTRAVQLKKVDASTNKPIAGAEVEIVSENGNVVYRGVSGPDGLFPAPETTDVPTETSDTPFKAVGTTFPELPIGTYKYYEVQAPNGYVRDVNDYTFTITGEEPVGFVYELVLKNENVMGSISITKVGERFVTVETLDEPDATYYKPNYADGTLKDAVFEVFAAEDIVTPDGTIRVEKGTSVGTMKTDDFGTAKIDGLYLGTYVVKEIEAPNGYIMSEDGYTVTINSSIPNVEIEPIDNKRHKVTVELNKVMEYDATGILNPDVEIKKVSFGLFADEDIFADDGSCLPKDGLIEKGTLVEGGKFFFREYLPYGSYYVKELSTSELYILDEKEVKFIVGEDSSTVIDLNDKSEFVNDWNKTDVVFKKVVSGTDEPLSGATIEIYYLGNNIRNRIYSGITGEDGTLVGIPQLPIGRYAYKEIEAPYGYNLDENEYIFEIKGTEKSVELKLSNTLSTGGIEITKKDIVTDETLPNCKIRLYSENGELLIERVTDENGIVVFDQLPFGKYYYQEVEAPENYVLDTNKYPFEIKEDGVIIKAVMVNKLGEGSLEITKKDIVSDEALPNCKIRVYTENDELFMEKVTDENGVAIFPEIPIGKYYYQEIEAPEGYVLDTNKYPFEITENGEIVKAIMTNKLGEGSLEITKTDIVTDEPLPNCTIRVYKENGEVFMERVTDKNGLAVFPEIPIGRYYYQEFGAPVGYELDTNKYPFEIKENGEIIKCIMKDRKTPEVVVSTPEVESKPDITVSEVVTSSEVPFTPESSRPDVSSTPVRVETPDVSSTPVTSVVPKTPVTGVTPSTPVTTTSTPGFPVITGDVTGLGIFLLILVASGLLILISKKKIDED